MLLFSVFLLLRGHNEPGGGFAGGLVAAAGFAMHAIAFDVAHARKQLGVHPRTLLGLGLLCAMLSGVFSMLRGEVFMRGLWTEGEAPLLGKIALGTPLLFDIGVYLVVIGFTLLIIYNLAEDGETPEDRESP
jgi:multicomponent Na+:H+ antiporter subunit B